MAAFGAGAVAGLYAHGVTTGFAVVTGVSVGALVAPYAFLGSTWDGGLLEVFTRGAGENLLQSRGLGRNLRLELVSRKAFARAR